MGLAELERALGPQRKPFRVAYRLNRQVNIKIRPIKMIRRRPQDVENLLNRCRLKPGKFRIGKRQLFIANQDPDAMSGNIRDLSRQSGCSRHR